jgi:hypothetical protein
MGSQLSFFCSMLLAAEGGTEKREGTVSGTCHLSELPKPTREGRDENQSSRWSNICLSTDPSKTRTPPRHVRASWPGKAPSNTHPPRHQKAEENTPCPLW